MKSSAMTRDMIRTAKKLDAQIKELSGELSTIKNQIKDIAAAEGQTSYQWSDMGVKIVSSTRCTVSAKELKKVAPDIFASLAHYADSVSIRFN